MTGRILITGGAGFIGAHLSRGLLARGYEVRILDAFIEQVHQGRTTSPLARDVEIIHGDVRDSDRVRSALAGVDKVVHLAAEVGVGQSMYAIDRYVSVNDLGTAVLLQSLLEQPKERIVVASSMSIYGEGLYRTALGQYVEDAVRPRTRDAGWDPIAADGSPLVPVPTPEWKRPSLASVYALTKYVQERMTLNVAEAYGMEGVALRLFNVYGSGQALSNPYTGVLAIFASRLLNKKPPVIFEDGHQRRDFVHVDDVVAGFISAIERPQAVGKVFNIASGADRSIRDVARSLAAAMGSSIEPEISGKARSGDIRHCIADITAAKDELGFAPRRDFNDGLVELTEWVRQQEAEDFVPMARNELEARGLVS